MEGGLSIPRSPGLQAEPAIASRARGAYHARMRRLFLLSGLLLSGCAAADGKWPSLRTAEEQKGSTTSPAMPVPSATADVPVTPVAGTAPPAPEATSERLAPAVTRLQQEARALDFALDQLAKNQTAQIAAKAAAAGKPAKSPETLAMRAEERRRGQLLADIADIKSASELAIGDLAIAAVAGESVDKPLAEAGLMLLKLVRATSGTVPLPQINALAASLGKTEKRFVDARTAWQSEAQKLRASATAVKTGDPGDINWNQAQIGLTRVNQSAQAFETVREEAGQIAGQFALLAASGTQVSDPLARLGRLLSQIDALQAENGQLVNTTRRALERS